MDSQILHYESLVRRDGETVRQEHQQNLRALAQLTRELAAGAPQAPEKKHFLVSMLRVLALPKHLFNRFMNRAIDKLPSRYPGYTLPKLTDWLAYAAYAGLPHIAAEKGTELTTDELETAFEVLNEGGEIPAFLKERVLPWINQVQEKGWMWRFEECASQTIKEVMGCMRPENYLKITKIKVPFSVDSRVLHCHWDSREKTTRLVARPWVNATFEAGFPVEIRVFRIKGEKSGWAASNYYVQRPLPEKYRGTAAIAIELTKELELRSTTNPREGLPAFPTSGYTVDWLLTAEGKLVMIEAGPPFTLQGGAHPCCFNLEGIQPGRIALSAEPNSHFYCPPETQAFVDRLKNGEDPTQFALGPEETYRVIAFAAVQGCVDAQKFLKAQRN